MQSILLFQPYLYLKTSLNPYNLSAMSTPDSNPPASGLNQAQRALIRVITSITDEQELNELRMLVARHLADKLRKSLEGEAERLGVNTRKGADEFMRKNHFRTPYGRKPISPDEQQESKQ